MLHTMTQLLATVFWRGHPRRITLITLESTSPTDTPKVEQELITIINYYRSLGYL